VAIRSCLTGFRILDTVAYPVLTSDIVVSEHARNITLQDALAAIRRSVPLIATESIDITAAGGSVLRQDVLSDIDYPNAGVSAVDGYCLLALDTSDASGRHPSVLRVRGTVRAGEVPSFEIKPGECAGLTTGSVLPGGADAVTRGEDVTAKNGVVRVSAPIPQGSLVRRIGEVVRKGDAVLKQGSMVTPAAVGLLTAVAVGPLEVSRKPRVGVLSTGDEIVPSGVQPGPGRVRNSNAQMLLSLVRELGLPVFDAGISGDDESEIARGVEACSGCDVVILTGGTAGGRHDLVGDALRGVGARPVFRGLRMLPGKHMLFALDAGRVYICLPGNPVACFVLFHMLARPAILAMMGAAHPIPAPSRARWAAAARSKPDMQVMLPGRLLEDMRAEPVPAGGSADVLALARTDCLVSLAEGLTRVRRGQQVDVFPTGGARWSA
jgi:molybdenum cofactor synthesis domain-containing protein